MDALDLRVARTVRQHALLSRGDRVAVALSGGADSVALAATLEAIAAAGEIGFEVAGLIHVNHGLRGEESAADEAFCRAYAARAGRPIEVGQFDVGSAARASRRSLEAAARDVRYEFFAAAAARLGATRIATGHTLDDQAETVLLRLLRGAGARGVSGIRIRRGLFIRPLLECRRAAVREYLDRRGDTFREDSSNRDESIARNRVRHQLLPVIERIAPSGVRALARFAALANDDEDYLTKAAIEAVPTVVLSEEGGVQLDVGLLAALPAALSRRVIRRMAELASGGSGVSARHLDAVRALAAADNVSGHLDLPGLTIRRRGRIVSATPSAARSAADGAARVAFEHALPVPGQVPVPEAGVKLEAAHADSGVARDGRNGRGTEVTIQAASVTLPLVVRNRRPGDRMKPIGAPGRRKLQDVLVDRKIPRHERDAVPIVVDAAGRIVWVVGVAVAHECRITTPGEKVVVLKAYPLEKGEE